jgi:hypothetical protein
MNELHLTAKIPQLEFKLGIDYFVFSSNQINRNMLKDLVKKEKMVFIYLTVDHTNQILNPVGFSKIIRKCLNKIDWYLSKIHKSKIQCENEFVFRQLDVFSSSYISIYSHNLNVSLENFTSGVVSTMTTTNDVWFAPVGLKKEESK